MTAKRKAACTTLANKIESEKICRIKITQGKQRRAKEPRQNLHCPIVGLAVRLADSKRRWNLLRHLPPSTGVAFVIVQHLDPHHASRLPKSARQSHSRCRSSRWQEPYYATTEYSLCPAAEQMRHRKRWEADVGIRSTQQLNRRHRPFF